MKKYLEGTEYKDLNRETKRVLTLQLFMKHQAMEALKGNVKRALLDREDVMDIIKNTPEVPSIPKKVKIRKPRVKKVSIPTTPLGLAEKEVKDLTAKENLTDDEKKVLRRAKDRIRYYKNKAA